MIKPPENRKGRPESVDRVAIKFFRERGYPMRVIAKLACCSQSSVEKVLKEEAALRKEIPDA